jgi:hypothetical protein
VWRQFELVARRHAQLQRLPTGLRLNLITTVAERERHRNDYAEVEHAAASDGLVLEIQTPR